MTKLRARIVGSRAHSKRPEGDTNGTVTLK
jgi:hypothetical protein